MAGKGKGKGKKSLPKLPSGEVDLENLPPGTTLYCKWTHDDNWYLGSLLEKRNISDGTQSVQKYYVHYEDFNRRMDEWLPLDRIYVVPDSGELTAEIESSLNNANRKFGKAEEEEHGMDEASLKEHEKLTKVKNIGQVQLGKYLVDTWYFSPFPKEYCDVDVLYFCEFCLSFKKTRNQLERHLQRCHLRHPPGDEIYRDGSLSMFEVDGANEKVYCQNLAYLAKLFLDHKTLYFDVDPFLFYVMCENDEYGYHIVGYFSKEKDSDDGYNLACILTLPPYQNRGYGKFLIQFSYELSKKEKKVGSPEKPLSDLGKLSYHSYWTREVTKLLLKKTETGVKEVPIQEVCDATSITPEDVAEVMVKYDMVKFGDEVDKHGKKKPVSIILPDKVVLKSLFQKSRRPKVEVDAEKLHWIPIEIAAPKK